MKMSDLLEYYPPGAVFVFLGIVCIIISLRDAGLALIGVGIGWYLMVKYAPRKT